MRFFVDISSIGKPGTQRYCLEAEQWQRALHAVRSLRGEESPFANFSIELMDDGYRAIDPATRTRYVVQAAPDDAEIATTPSDVERPNSVRPAATRATRRSRGSDPGPKSTRVGAASVPAPAPSGPPMVPEPAPSKPRLTPPPKAAEPSVPPSAVKSATDAKKKSVSIPTDPVPRPQTPLKTSSPPVAEKAPAPGPTSSKPPSASRPEAPRPTAPTSTPPKSGNGSTPPSVRAPSRPMQAETAFEKMTAGVNFPLSSERHVADLATEILPPFSVVFRRAQEPTREAPLAYREMAFAVSQDTTVVDAEALVRAQFEIVRASLSQYPSGRYINLSVFDHEFVKRPQRPPITTLTFRDWRDREPDVRFPMRDGPPPRLSSPPGIATSSIPPARVQPSAIPPAAPTRVNANPSVPNEALPSMRGNIHDAQTREFPAAAKALGIGGTDIRAAREELTVVERLKATTPIEIPDAPESLTSVMLKPPGDDEAHSQAANMPFSAAPATMPEESRVTTPPSTLPSEGAIVPTPVLSVGMGETAVARSVPPAALEVPSAPPVAPSPVVPSSPPAPSVPPVAPSVPPVGRPASVPPPAPPVVPERPRSFPPPPPVPVLSTRPSAPPPAAPVEETPDPADFAKTIQSARPAPVVSFPDPSDQASALGGSLGAPASPSVAPEIRTSQAPLAASESQPPVSIRKVGDDLISDLFEALSDLEFLSDPLDGAEFVLRVAGESFPAELGLVSFFSLDTREFVVVRSTPLTPAMAGAPNAMLLRRAPEKSAVIARAMRSQQAVVLIDDAAEIYGADPRFAGLQFTPKTAICGPVTLGGRYLGLIELIGTADGEPFTAAEGNALTYIGQTFGEFLAKRDLVMDPDRVTAPRHSSRGRR